MENRVNCRQRVTPHCIICGTSQHVRFFGNVVQTHHPNRPIPLLEPREADYYRCAQCKLIFQFPLPTEEQLKAVYEWDDYYSFPIRELAKRYRQEVAGYPNSYYGSRLALMERFLTIGQPRSLLEIGSGHSMLVKLAQDHGWQALGVETSEKWARAARESIDANVFCGSIQNLSRGEYTVVALFDVIEHLSDPVGFMQRAREFIAPNGWLFVLMPNAEDLAVRLLHRRKWAYLLPHEHLCLFGPKAMHLLLQQSGLVLRKEIPRNTFLSYHLMPAFHQLLSNCKQILLGRFASIKPVIARRKLKWVGSYIYVVQRLLNGSEKDEK